MSFNYTFGEKLSAIYAKEGLEGNHYHPVVSQVFDIDSVRCGAVPEIVIVDIDRYFEILVKYFKDHADASYCCTKLIAFFDVVNGKFINIDSNIVLFDKEMVDNAISKESDVSEKKEGV